MVRVDGGPSTTLRVLTYNVFAGTPTDSLGGSLENSGRLSAQIERIRALRVDVICLQEIYRDSSAQRYADALAHDGFAAHWTSLPVYRRLLPFLAWHLLSLLPSLAAAGILPSTAGGLPGGSHTIGWFIYLLVRAWTNNCTLRNFLVGVSGHTPLILATQCVCADTCQLRLLMQEVDGGLVTLYRKDKVLPKAAATTTTFACLGGEWEDQLLFKWLRPRSFHQLRLRLNDSALPSGIDPDALRESDRSIALFNLHALLGHHAEHTNNRKEQLRQIIQAAPRDHCVIIAGDLNAIDGTMGAQVLVDEGSFVDCSDAVGEGEQITWSSDNVLTQGWHNAEDNSRVDYVYFRRRQHVSDQTSPASADACWLEPTASTTVLNERPFLSDHYGVLTTFQLAAENRQLVRTAERRLRKTRQSSLSPPVSPPCERASSFDDSLTEANLDDQIELKKEN